MGLFRRKQQPFDIVCRYIEIRGHGTEDECIEAEETLHQLNTNQLLEALVEYGNLVGPALTSQSESITKRIASSEDEREAVNVARRLSITLLTDSENAVDVINKDFGPLQSSPEETIYAIKLTIDYMAVLSQELDIKMNWG